MSVVSQSPSVSPRAFRLFSIGVLAFTLAVIVWGAYVRATGSGAGCGAHWPICNGQVVPHDVPTRTLIEFSHRASSGLSLILVLALGVWAWRTHPKRHPVRRTATAAVVLMLTEAALGAGLVLLELVALDASARRAIAMSLHLMNTFLLLAALGSCVWHAHVGPRVVRVRGALGSLLMSALGGFVLVGISGAIAALGDTLSQLGVQNAFVDLLIGMRASHPALAICEAVLLLSAGSTVWARRPEARSATLTLAVLCTAQLGLGALNVALKAPVFMQLIHLLVADGVWLALVITARAALSSGEPAAAPEAPVGSVGALD
jgi:cytochrome c oxidase assembly protein subunit 15